MAQNPDSNVFYFDSLINYPEDLNAFACHLPVSAAAPTDVFDFPHSAPGQAENFGFVPSATADFSFYNNAYLSPSSSTVNETFTASPQDFRSVVDDWASVDSRARPMKQKRRDAAIDLHIQRSSSAPYYPHSLQANSQKPSYAHSASYSRESSQESFVEKPPSAGSFSNPTPGSSSCRSEQLSPSGSLELVLDMNMNTTTRLPKKQRKRTKAEIEDYINVRRNGACIKHRKQHKKCNCLDKAASTPTTKPKTRVLRGNQQPSAQDVSLHAQSQSPSASQVTSSHPLSRTDNLTWSGLGDSNFSTSDPFQGVQLSPHGESAQSSSLVHQQPHFTCLMPHCTFRTYSLPELNNHYKMHPGLRNTPSDVRYRQNMEPGLQQPYIEQPLQVIGSGSYIEPGIAALFSSPSTASSMSLSTSQVPVTMLENQAMCSPAHIIRARGLESTVHQPPDETLDPLGGFQPSSSMNHQRRNHGPHFGFHQRLEELPFEAEKLQQSQATNHRLRDRDSRAKVHQPLEEPSSEAGRLQTGEVYDHRLRSRGLQVNIQQPLEELSSDTGGLQLSQRIDYCLRDRGSRVNVYQPLEEALSWGSKLGNEKATTNLLELTAFSVENHQSSLLLATIAAIQAFVTTFNAIVWTMQGLSAPWSCSQWFTHRQLFAIPMTQNLA